MIALGRWLLGLLLLLIVVGLFRGWFSFSQPSPNAEGDRVNINVSVDTAKVKADAQKAEAIGEKVAQRIKERRETPAEPK